MKRLIDFEMLKDLKRKILLFHAALYYLVFLSYIEHYIISLNLRHS